MARIPSFWIFETGGGVAAKPWLYRYANEVLGAMKKNVAGQKIGAQMISATDGSAFTGSVTVYVTVDAGTQAAGSVGSGACTHEGNGYHTYSPAQAETNGDVIGWTFVGSGAVPTTVQTFTDAAYDAINATPAVNVTQISGDATAADNLEAACDGGTYNVGGGAIVAASVTADVSISSDYDAAKTAAQAGDAMTLANDAVSAAALKADAVTEIADGVLARDLGSGTNAGVSEERTVRSALRFLRNKWAISGTTLTVTAEDDSTPMWTSALTGSASADPVTGSDPT
jgi:hypothetical protein